MEPRTHYTQIPHIIDDSDLSPHAFRLYCHIKRVAGEGGECWQGTAKLAECCKMSTGAVSKARKELIKSGFVQHLGSGPNGAWVLKPVNVWDLNGNAYTQIVHNVNDSSCSEGEDHSHGERNRSHGERDTPNHSHGERNRSHYETKNNPEENPLLQEEQKEDPPPSRSTDPHFAEFCQITENAGFGMMTPFLSDQLKTWMEEYANEWIRSAFDIAIKRNKRSYSYINGILKNMRSDGPKEQKRNGTSNRSYAGTDTSRGDHPAWNTETHRRLASTPYNAEYANIPSEEITF